MNSSTDGLTSNEDEALTRLLKKWAGGRVSTPVFTELARICPQLVIEVVILRTHKQTLETLLVPRPEDDIVWPGKLHTPGTVLRASDFKYGDQTPIDRAFKRIQQGEIRHSFLRTPVFVDRFYRYVDRGPEFVQLYRAELSKNVVLEPNIIWFPVHKLADNPKFIPFQLEQVKLASKSYSA